MIQTDPQNLDLPELKNAKLPAIYSAAKESISKCARVDECKDWANKADRLASYAKQAGDEEMVNYAKRIKARAINQCGVLIKEIKAAQGSRTDKLRSGVEQSPVDKTTRSQFAKDAGMSKRQKETALRVANVPRDQFEAAVESDKPPTVTQLAQAGTRSNGHSKVVFDQRGCDLNSAS